MHQYTSPFPFLFPLSNLPFTLALPFLLPHSAILPFLHVFPPLSPLYALTYTQVHMSVRYLLLLLLLTARACRYARHGSVCALAGGGTARDGAGWWWWWWRCWHVLITHVHKGYVCVCVCVQLTFALFFFALLGGEED